ncbi:hypothetical protein [Piscinibacter sp.]|uniref:hypothetical protein n=1 Tax=Piscinibacter sp. TaxID=1903157 RepID=UPI002B5179BE|nr:hypothetical protein [Albitalea sp.]HUG22610.1 hypothetical protein [Albitalea sp.]
MSLYVEFEAPLADGALGLHVPVADDHRADAVAAAQALSRCEPLLAALETWLAVALDPVPLLAADDRPPSTGRLTASVTRGTLAPAGTRLFVPLELALRRGALPNVLQSDALVWASLSVEVELARYAEPPLPRSGLATGGMLLLPRSFEPPWRVQLCNREHRTEWAAHWRGPGHPFEPTGAADRLQEHPPGAWRVVLAAPLLLDPAPWLAGAAMPPGQLPDDAAAWLLAPARGVPIAHGSVVPALQGAGLWLVPGVRPAMPPVAQAESHPWT